MRKKKKRPEGRPTLYRPSMCEDIIAFFNRPRYISKMRKVIDSEGNVTQTEYEEPNETPFLIHWCHKNNISHDAVIDWAKKYPEFSVAYNKAKSFQEAFLTELGIKGDHNGFMTFQTLKNVSGWRDKQEVEQKVEGTQVVILKYAKD